MAVRKSELYASLWASCDELRGGMAACVQLSILRVAERVAHGGQDVPLAVLQRRLPRSIRLFLET